MNFRKLATLAIDVAQAAPLRAGARYTNAYVPWNLILEIREECDRLGIKWAETHPQAPSNNPKGEEP